MRQTITALLLVFCFGAVCQTSDELYNQALKFYEAKQYYQAVPILEKLAHQDHAKACNMLGIILCNGYTGKVDYEKGYEYFVRSAESGFDVAMDNLAGWFYENDGFREWWEGKNASLASDQAAKWYIRAAKANGKQSAHAYYNLAIVYLFPKGTEYKDGLPCVEKAAQMGFVDAMIAIGIESEPAQAMEWLKKAKAEGAKNVDWWAGIDENITIDELMLVQDYCLKSNKLRLVTNCDVQGCFYTLEHAGSNLVAELSTSKYEDTVNGQELTIAVFSKNGNHIYSLPSFFHIYYEEEKGAWHFETSDGNVEWLDLSGSKPRVIATEKRNY